MFTGVQRPVLKFSEICTFSVLYKAYLAARRGKRSRAATANYEVHLLANIVNLVYILQTKIYRPGLFRVCLLYTSVGRRDILHRPLPQGHGPL